MVNARLAHQMDFILVVIIVWLVIHHANNVLDQIILNALSVLVDNIFKKIHKYVQHVILIMEVSLTVEVDVFNVMHLAKHVQVQAILNV